MLQWERNNVLAVMYLQPLLQSERNNVSLLTATQIAFFGGNKITGRKQQTKW